MFSKLQRLMNVSFLPSRVMLTLCALTRLAHLNVIANLDLMGLELQTIAKVRLLRELGTKLKEKGEAIL